MPWLMRCVYFGQAARMTKIDWSLVDWSMRTSDIANRLNVCNDTVSRRRRRLAPETIHTQYRDWDKVDWTKSNRQIAAELGRAYNTVVQMRCKLGQSGKAKERATRRDKGVNRTTYIPPPEQQKHATENARKSPKSGKFESNIHAKMWQIVSPDNQVFIVKNLYQFVRDNPHLFNPMDIVFKRQGGKRGTGGEYCNATAGLLNVSNKRQRKWKGWDCRLIEDIK